MDRALVAAQHPALVPRGDVPHAGRAVRRGRHQPAAVGAESRRSHSTGMTAQRRPKPAGPGVPQRHDRARIVRTANDVAPVGADREVPDPARRRLEGQQPFAAGGVPRHDRVTGAAAGLARGGEDAVAVRAPDGTVAGRPVPHQRAQPTGPVQPLRRFLVADHPLFQQREQRLAVADVPDADGGVVSRTVSALHARGNGAGGIEGAQTLLSVRHDQQSPAVRAEADAPHAGGQPRQGQDFLARPHVPDANRGERYRGVVLRRSDPEGLLVGGPIDRGGGEPFAVGAQVEGPNRPEQLLAGRRAGQALQPLEGGQVLPRCRVPDSHAPVAALDALPQGVDAFVARAEGGEQAPAVVAESAPTRRDYRSRAAPANTPRPGWRPRSGPCRRARR